MNETLAAPAGPNPLRSVLVRRCEREELERLRFLIRSHHYLGFRGVVGESVAHIAEVDGKWVAVLLWAAAALKCRAREAWIGWHPSVAWRRLHLVANNVRFLILPGVTVPNLASRVLGLSARRLPGDWKQAWGHTVVLAETFVDPARFSGVCYRAAGWIELGRTRGFARQCGGWRHHGNSKMIFVRELRRGAREALRDPNASVEHDQGVAPMMIRQSEIPSLMKALKKVKDPRQRRGIRHSKTSLLAISVVAVLSGARSLEAIAQWGQQCTQSELSRLGCSRNRRSGKIVAPSEPTLRRFLKSVDAESVDRIVGQWLVSLQLESEDAIAIDGKTVRGARRADKTQVHLLSAVLQSSGITVAQVEVDGKSNEIPAAYSLLEPLPLDGKLVTADALHTQRELARFLVEDKHTDYCFTVKGNQPTLKADIDLLFDGVSFPPSAPNA